MRTVGLAMFAALVAGGAMAQTVSKPAATKPVVTKPQGVAPGTTAPVVGQQKLLLEQQKAAAKDAPDDHPLVAHFHDWRGAAARLDYPRLFRSILDDTRVIERALATGGGTRTVTNLGHVFEHLYAEVERSRCELPELAATLRSWIADGDDRPARPRGPGLRELPTSTALREPAPRPAADDAALALYRKGQAALKARDHAAAIEAFRALITQHPTNDYADNAQYWIGEAYYDQKDYARAVSEFRATVAAYPLGNKVPDALYTLRTALRVMPALASATSTSRRITSVAGQPE